MRESLEELDIKELQDIAMSNGIQVEGLTKEQIINALIRKGSESLPPESEKETP